MAFPTDMRSRQAEGLPIPATRSLPFVPEEQRMTVEDHAAAGSRRSSARRSD